MIDVDGVLIVHPAPQGWSADLERDLGISKQALQDAFFKPHWADIIHGRAELRSRLAAVLAQLAPNVSADALIRYWFEHDAHIDRDLLGQLAECRRQGLELHLATVQEHERADYLWRSLGLERHFDAIHYAAGLGWAKPAQGFFAAIEERTGFQPRELLLIDDAQQNVSAALARGWGAALWTRQDRLADLIAKAAAQRLDCEHRQAPPA